MKTITRRRRSAAAKVRLTDRLNWEAFTSRNAALVAVTGGQP